MNINYIVEEIDKEEYLFWFEESNKYLTCNLSIYNLLRMKSKEEISFKIKSIFQKTRPTLS